MQFYRLGVYDKAMGSFFWIANNLALDLANTLALDENGCETDLMASFDDLLAWVVESGMAPESAAARVKTALDTGQKKKMVELGRVNRG